MTAVKLPAAIRSVCAAHYGRYVGAGRWSPPNRCDACPVRAPCRAWGGAPARSDAELVEARETFVREASKVIAGGEASQ